MSHYIIINGVKVVEIIDDGIEVFAIDLINNKYIKLNDCYSINSALIELNENNIASTIVDDNRFKKIISIEKKL